MSKLNDMLKDLIRNIKNFDGHEMSLGILTTVGIAISKNIPMVGNGVLFGAAVLTFFNSEVSKEEDNKEHNKSKNYLKKLEESMDFLILNFSAVVPSLGLFTSKMASQALAQATINLLGQVATPLLACIYFKESFKLLRNFKEEKTKLNEDIKNTWIEYDNSIDDRSKIFNEIKKLEKKYTEKGGESIAIEIKSKQKEIEKINIKLENTSKNLNLLKKRQTLNTNKMITGLMYVGLGLLATAAFACMFFPPAAAVVTPLFIAISVGTGLVNGVYKKLKVEKLEEEIKKIESTKEVTNEKEEQNKENDAIEMTLIEMDGTSERKPKQALK